MKKEITTETKTTIEFIPEVKAAKSFDGSYLCLRTEHKFIPIDRSRRNGEPEILAICEICGALLLL